MENNKFVTKDIEPKIWSDMPFNDYLLLEGLNNSALKTFIQSPHSFSWEYLRPNAEVPTPSSSMNLGTALHSWILDDEQNFVVAPKVDKRTKKGKEEWAAFTESITDKNTPILTPSEHQRLIGMVNAVKHNKLAQKVLTQDLQRYRYHEHTFQWNIGEYLGIGLNLLAKARIDLFSYIPDKWINVVDIKTTSDASLSGVTRATENFLYHIQAAYYMHCLLYFHPDIDESDIRFSFLYIENKPPYNVGVYQLAEEYIDMAFSQIRHAINNMEWCIEKNIWPSYNGLDSKPKVIPLRQWAVITDFTTYLEKENERD